MRDTPINEVENVASATECTGLVPSLPLNDPEADQDLAQLYAVLPPKKRNGIRWEGNERREQKKRPQR